MFSGFKSHVFRKHVTYFQNLSHMFFFGGGSPLTRAFFVYGLEGDRVSRNGVSSESTKDTKEEEEEKEGEGGGNDFLTGVASKVGHDCWEL
jgi:hypothetical protein